MPAEDHKPRPSLIAKAQGYRSAARAALRAAADNLDALEGVLQEALEEGVEGAVEALPDPTAPPTEHRRAHRPGKPRKLDADAELQAFVRARIDRMTFDEIAAAVADHFPPDRRVAKSAIHDWWKRNRPDRPQR